MQSRFTTGGRLVYAGRLLGRTRGEFIPGAGLLRELCKIKGSNRVWIDDRVGWLFACGRDVFEESILRSEGKMIEGAYFLVMLGENCLGYVRVETQEGKRILKNVFDLGDFLRREWGIRGRRILKKLYYRLVVPFLERLLSSG